MDITTTLNEIIQLTIKVIGFFKDQVKAYKELAGSAKDLKTKIEQFEILIKPALEYESHPVHSFLAEFREANNTSKNEIKAFLEKEEANAAKPRRKQFFNRYILKRALRASDLKQLFNAADERIDKNSRDLEVILQISDQMMKTGAHRFRDTMSAEAYEFWQTIMGNDLASQGPMWGRFLKAYQQKYKEFNSQQWDAGISARMKAIACVDGEDMTIGGYALLTKKCGFPLNPANLPSMLNMPVNISAQTRHHVVTSVNELILFFSTEEMRQHFVTIYSWYKDIDQKPKKKEKEKLAQWVKQCQKRADQWAITFKSLREKKKTCWGWTTDDHLYNDIEMARRTIFYFYHRFQAMVKIGQLSKELFKDMDFPGKPRLHDFLDFVKPLDKANYDTVLENGVHPWEKNPSKVPQVYLFIEGYLKELEEETTTTPEAASITVLKAASSPLSPENPAIVSTCQSTHRGEFKPANAHTFIAYLHTLQLALAHLFQLNRIMLAFPVGLFSVVLITVVIDMLNI